MPAISTAQAIARIPTAISSIARLNGFQRCGLSLAAALRPLRAALRNWYSGHQAAMASASKTPAAISRISI